MRALVPLLAVLPAPVLAEALEQPAPGETGAAAVNYAIAALALVLALGVAQWLVSRR